MNHATEPTPAPAASFDRAAQAKTRPRPSTGIHVHAVAPMSVRPTPQHPASAPDRHSPRSPHSSAIRGRPSIHTARPPHSQKLGRLDIALGQIQSFRFDQAEDASSSRSDAAPAATKQVRSAGGTATVAFRAKGNHLPACGQARPNIKGGLDDRAIANGLRTSRPAPATTWRSRGRRCNRALSAARMSKAIARKLSMCRWPSVIVGSGDGCGEVAAPWSAGPP